ncbi:MAG: hypothetical protein HQ534_02880 [Armatimonadetes bacterium]|nr:hypothetical protein [Armatimonadota bacterium]
MNVMQNQESSIYSEIGVIEIPVNCLSLSTGYSIAYPDLNPELIIIKKKEKKNVTPTPSSQTTRVDC